jgi:Flp pilus assembly protein CpaB
VDVPQARRLTRPAWVNLRTALGLALFSGAWVGTQQVLDHGDTTVAMWAAARDLGQDHEVGPGDLTAVDVRLPGDVADGYASVALSLEGFRISRPIGAGELVPEGWLVDQSEALEGRAISVPVVPEHAVGGELRPGDRVDVFATFNAEDLRARTVVVVRSAEVVEVMSSGGVVLGEEAVTGITLAVGTEEAARLAFAVRAAEIDVVKVVGVGDATEATTVRIGDFP